MRELLDLQIISKLTKLYTDNKWSLDNGFDDFCKMLSKYTVDEQSLILEISRDFLCINSDSYEIFFREVFEKMICDIQATTPKDTTIYITSLLREKDLLKPKSSVVLYYLIKGKSSTYAKISNKHNIKIIFADIYESVSKPHDTKFLCLVDDFIGTGDTSNQVLEFWAQRGWAPENIIILSIVAQESGLNRIKCSYKGSHYIRKKGLSENPRIPLEAIDIAKQLMQDIESKMKVPKKYNFGYGQSESLVKMIRTPNNTFPVFWCPTSYSPEVPFLREG